MNRCIKTEEERVRVKEEREKIGHATALEETSGEFDRRLRAHYEEPG
jgi:hypothetical protein